MKNQLENLLLVGLLALTVSACSSTSRKVAYHEGVKNEKALEFERHIASLETSLDKEATATSPKRTILKKEVHWNTEGLEGQCYIMEGGNVRVRSTGYDKTAKIPAQIQLRKSVVTYNEEVVRELVTRAFEGKAVKVSQGENEEAEGPLVSYAAFGKTASGVTKAKILKIKNYEGSVYLNNGLETAELVSTLEAIDAICK